MSSEIDKGQALASGGSQSPRLPAAIEAQWQFGEWASLRSLPPEWIEGQEARSTLSAMVAVAFQQEGEPQIALEFIQKSLDWGASRSDVSRILIAGALNSLGRARLLSGSGGVAIEHFQASVVAGSPGVDERLLTPARARLQAIYLGVPTEAPELTYNIENSLAPELSPSAAGDEACQIREEFTTERLMRILADFADRLVEYGRDLEVDKVKVFDQKDPFLPGKIANALAYWVTEYPLHRTTMVDRCKKFRAVMSISQESTIESWGIYFYLKALQVLNEANLLTECFSFQDLNQLRIKLDWRTFVKETDYTLIKKPNNFYSIAYSIAYFRYLLGWDSIEHSQKLLEKELDHYEEVSGDSGFADETKGKGRFDRYSFLLIAEIANRFYEAGLPLTSNMKRWLRESANYVMFNANARGDGFQYGRSIGAYGDSAFLEILTAAAAHNVLEKEELLPAFAFCNKITEKFLDFWWVEDRRSINIWSDGRATDDYRGKHRILGENLSLLHQHLYCHRFWRELTKDMDVVSHAQILDSWIDRLPAARLTRFASGDCDYAVFNRRDGNRLISLPLVNGDLHYKQMAYHPTPFVSGMIQPIPDMEIPVLVPEIVLENGSSCIAYPCFSEIEFVQDVGGATLSWNSAGATLLELKYPEKQEIFTTKTVVRFSRGQISKKEFIEFEDGLAINCVRFTLPVSANLNVGGSNNFSFVDQAGAECELSVGADCDIERLENLQEEGLNSIEGRYEGLCRLSLRVPESSKLELIWTIKYPEYI